MNVILGYSCGRGLISIHGRWIRSAAHQQFSCDDIEEEHQHSRHQTGLIQTCFHKDLVLSYSSSLFFHEPLGAHRPFRWPPYHGVSSRSWAMKQIKITRTVEYGGIFGVEYVFHLHTHYSLKHNAEVQFGFL